MAMWKAEVSKVGTGSRDFLYFSSADAKSMKRADLNAATKKAAARAKERFAKKGVAVRVLSVGCVG